MKSPILSAMVLSMALVGCERESWLTPEDTYIDEAGKPIVDGEPYWYYTEGRNSITFLDFVPEEARTVEIVYTVRSSITD